MIKQNKICGVYLLRNLINNKVYVGQSINIYYRWNQHKYNALNNKLDDYLHRAIRKYGWENFSKEIIEECSPEELNEKEIFYIQLYDSYAKNKESHGYNETIGGEGVRGFHHSDETKNLLSQIEVTENTRLKMRESNKRKKPIICEGKIFSCIAECADYYCVDQYKMAHWVSGRREIPKEFVEKGLSYYGYNPNYEKFIRKNKICYKSNPIKIKIYI